MVHCTVDLSVFALPYDEAARRTPKGAPFWSVKSLTNSWKEVRAQAANRSVEDLPLNQMTTGPWMQLLKPNAHTAKEINILGDAVEYYVIEFSDWMAEVLKYRILRQFISETCSVYGVRHSGTSLNLCRVFESGMTPRQFANLVLKIPALAQSDPESFLQPLCDRALARALSTPQPLGSNLSFLDHYYEVAVKECDILWMNKRLKVGLSSEQLTGASELKGFTAKQLRFAASLVKRGVAENLGNARAFAGKRMQSVKWRGVDAVMDTANPQEVFGYRVYYGIARGYGHVAFVESCSSQRAAWIPLHSTGNWSAKNTLRRQIRAWKRSADLSDEKVDMLVRYLSGKMGFTPIFTRDISSEAGHCESGQWHYIQQHGWANQHYVTGLWVMPTLGNASVVRMVQLNYNKTLELMGGTAEETLYINGREYTFV